MPHIISASLTEVNSVSHLAYQVVSGQGTNNLRLIACFKPTDRPQGGFFSPKNYRNAIDKLLAIR
jgi:hypothetical protein